MERARALTDERTLSGLLNRCLADWIAHGRQRELEARLREEYALGTAESVRVSRGFAEISERSGSRSTASATWGRRGRASDRSNLINLREFIVQT